MGIYDHVKVDAGRFMAILDISAEDYFDCRVYFNVDGEVLGDFVKRILESQTFAGVQVFDLTPFCASLIFEL